MIETLPRRLCAVPLAGGAVPDALLGHEDHFGAAIGTRVQGGGPGRGLRLGGLGDGGPGRRAGPWSGRGGSRWGP